MQLANDVKNEVKAARKMRLPWWGVLCVIIGALPIYWLFDHFGRLNIALPTLNCVGMLGFVIAVKWKLRRHVWFWATMAFLAALHLPLILFVPWTTKWVPAIAIAAIDSADLIVMLAILSVVGKFAERPKPSER
jgi:hypothetical protein